MARGSKSCGCKRGISCGTKFPVDKVSDHPLYGVWTDMNRRCYSPNRKDFKHYGGRGIEVCNEWVRTTKRGFLQFLVDMEETFEEGLEFISKSEDKYSKHLLEKINKQKESI